jgi:hypothetical protein
MAAVFSRRRGVPQGELAAVAATSPPNIFLAWYSLDSSPTGHISHIFLEIIYN